jgi:hypothetical protein
VPIKAVDAAAGLFSWQNPLNVPIVVKRLTLNVTTPATGACTADCGVAATEILNNTLIDGVDVGAAAIVADNIAHAGGSGLAAGVLCPVGSYITGSVASGASAGIVGAAII